VRSNAELKLVLLKKKKKSSLSTIPRPFVSYIFTSYSIMSNGIVIHNLTNCVMEFFFQGKALGAGHLWPRVLGINALLPANPMEFFPMFAEDLATRCLVQQSIPFC
jgi:hypothetical protein